MNRQIVIFYFSGTGNTLYLANKVKEYLIKQHHRNCQLIDLSKNTKLDFTKNNVYGFMFPVYAYGLPRIMRNFLLSLPKNIGAEAFAISNAGEGEGIALDEALAILNNKGFSVIGGKVIFMPQNFSPIFKLKNDEKSLKNIIALGKEDVISFIEELLTKKSVKYKKRNFIRRIFSYLISQIFLKIGTRIFYRLFKVDDNCNLCSICKRICPMNNIDIVNNKVIFGKNCEVCMRCLNACPQKSIQVWASKKHGRYNLLISITILYFCKFHAFSEPHP